MDRTRVVVGLGNPGPRYEKTRHNIGFRVLDRLAADLGAGPQEDEGTCTIRRARIGELVVVLVKPTTYMNRSGEALSRLGESSPASNELLTILDDVSLPFGTLRFRERGGDGGHKGLKSILEAVGTGEVARLRLGIGGEEEDRDLADFVLEPFSESEEEALEAWLDRASEGVQTFLVEGATAAMDRFNG